MSETTREVIRAQGVRRSFRVGPVEVHAVDGVDLAIERGEFAVLRGRSGSGKTTLLNLLGGLDRATAGEVYLNGRALSGLSDDEMTEVRRRDIGFVFQSFALLPTFSAYENVELPLRIARVDASERADAGAPVPRARRPRATAPTTGPTR